MAILRSFKEEKLSFEKALDRAKTGDIIVISSAPTGMVISSCRAFMEGVLSVIDGNVRLNNTLVCNNDERETHGRGFYPWYKGVIMYRVYEDMHEFYLIHPSDPTNSSKNTLIVPKLAFNIKAEQLEIIPLSSGKGLILKADKRILLLKRPPFPMEWSDKIEDKDVTVVRNGEYVLFAETPVSVIVGVEMSTPGGAKFIRFIRGCGRKQKAVHDHPDTFPPDIMATDEDLFYKGKIHGESFFISARTGQPMYLSSSELYVTSGALVQIEGTIVRANDVVVTKSFVADEGKVLAHAYGLLYVCSGEICMLVIK